MNDIKIVLDLSEMDNKIIKIKEMNDSAMQLWQKLAVRKYQLKNLTAVVNKK